MISDSTKPGIEGALRLVVAGTAAETGTEFFRVLVRNLAQALGTLGAWVTEYQPEQSRLRALAMWLKGGFVEHFEYSIAGTVCAEAVESRKLIHIPDQDEMGLLRDSPEQVKHQEGIDHRSLIDDENVRFQEIILVLLEPSFLRGVLKQSVNGFGLPAGGL